MISNAGAGKILAIATQNPDAVAETYIRQHIRLLKPGKTCVLHFAGTANTIPEIPVLKINQSRSTSPLNRLKRLWRFFKAGYPSALCGTEEKQVLAFLQQHNVEVVLAEFGPTGCSLMDLCHRAGIRLFVNFHGYDATVMPDRWFVRRSYRQLGELAEGVICGSEHFRKILESLTFKREKIHVIPCGVETSSFAPDAKKDPDLIIAVGRLTEKKAPHLTIQAFALAHAELPNLKLEVIGDGPLRALCERTISRYGLEKTITLHGATGHDFVIQRLSKASIFVQHSVTASNGDQESQGISLLEAMAASLPLVITDHNGFGELVEHDVNGYLVDEGNYKTMSKHIIRLARDPEKRVILGQHGRDIALDRYQSGSTLARLRTLLGR